MLLKGLKETQMTLWMGGTHKKTKTLEKQQQYFDILISLKFSYIHVIEVEMMRQSIPHAVWCGGGSQVWCGVE